MIPMFRNAGEKVGASACARHVCASLRNLWICDAGCGKPSIIARWKITACIAKGCPRHVCQEPVCTIICLYTSIKHIGDTKCRTALITASVRQQFLHCKHTLFTYVYIYIYIYILCDCIRCYVRSCIWTESIVAFWFASSCIKHACHMLMHILSAAPQHTNI